MTPTLPLAQKLAALHAQHLKALSPGDGVRLDRHTIDAKASEATIYVYDAITPEGLGGFSAKAMVDALAEAKGCKVVHVRINSPGGSVFEMKAMLQALREHPGKKVMHVDGLAASAASVIAMVGDEIVTSPEATWFIHGAQGLAFGSAAELRSTADLLDAETTVIRGVYAKRTGQSEDDLQAWMDAETFMDAKTAKARGFTDRIDGEADGPKATLDEPVVAATPAAAAVATLSRETRIRLARAGISRTSGASASRDATPGQPG